MVELLETCSDEYLSHACNDTIDNLIVQNVIMSNKLVVKLKSNLLICY